MRQGSGVRHTRAAWLWGPLALVLTACTATAPAAPTAAPPPPKPTTAAAPAATSAPLPATAAPAGVPTAQAAATTKPAPAAAAGGTKTIRVGITSGVRTFDPANYRDRNTETVIRNVFDGLYTVTPDGRPVPEMAESIRQIDPLTWEFKLRRGISFQNGDPVTADDVQWTFERGTKEGAMEGKTSPRQSLVGPVTAVEKVDNLTVRFRLSAPISEARMLYGVVNLQVMPKAYFQRVGADEFIKKPVGAGPFRFVEGKLDERVVLERYDQYWGGSPDLPGAPGPAKVDRVIFQVIADPAARVAALRAGDVDIIQDVPAIQVPVLQGDANVEVKTQRGTNMIYLAMNTTRPPFDDARTRRAVAMSIDYATIVKELYGGRADALAGVPLLPGGEVEDPSLRPYEYSVDRAKALLQEAGKTDISFVLDGYGDFTTLAQAVAQMLGKVGLKVEVRSWEVAALQSAASKGERTALITSFGNASLNPLWAYWVAGTGQPSNYSLYSNSRFDQIMEKAPSIVDPTERARAFREGWAIVYQELPALPLLVPRVVEASRRTVQNFTPSAGGRVNLHRVDLAPR